MRIIVSLTTWLKRIDTVYKTIDCMLNQTLKPDSIELNLSIEEFPNKEKDFSKQFCEYIKIHNNILHINYIEGNTMAFKKIIPTVKKYYNLGEYYLLSIDDDCIYDKDYIKIMIDNFENLNCDFMCMRQTGIAGSRMLYKSSCFEPDFLENFNKLPANIISKSVDDSYYYAYLINKGKKLGNFMPNNFSELFSFHDEIEPLHEKYR